LILTQEVLQDSRSLWFLVCKSIWKPFAQKGRLWSLRNSQKYISEIWKLWKW